MKYAIATGATTTDPNWALFLGLATITFALIVFFGTRMEKQDAEDVSAGRKPRNENRRVLVCVTLLPLFCGLVLTPVAIQKESIDDAAAIQNVRSID